MYRFFKRAFDIFVSFTGLVILSWLLLITAIAIKIESKGPIIFKQDRLGKGGKVFKTKYLSQQLGCSRLSFASGEDMERLLGVTPGSATVLALMNDPAQAVQLVIDRPVAAQEFMGCHPCKNTSSLKIRMTDVLDTFLPAVGHTPVYVELPVEETE